MIGSTITAQIILDHFDPVFILTAGAVEVPIEALRVRAVEGGDYEPRIVAEGHHLSLEHYAELARPGLGGIRQIMIGPGGGGLSQAIVPDQPAAGVMLLASGLQERRGHR